MLPSSFQSHIASHVVVLTTIYSAFAELNATEFYFLLHQETIPDPTLKQYPEVLFLSTELPAQFASVHPQSPMSSSRVYFNPYSIMPRMYLIIWLAVDQCTLFGYTKNGLRALPAKQISCLVLTRYMRDPISCLYKVGSTSLSYDASIFFQLEIMGVDMILQSYILNLFKIFVVYLPCPRNIYPSFYHTSNPKR